MDEQILEICKSLKREWDHKYEKVVFSGGLQIFKMPEVSRYA